MVALPELQHYRQQRCFPKRPFLKGATFNKNHSNHVLCRLRGHHSTSQPAARAPPKHFTRKKHLNYIHFCYRDVINISAVLNLKPELLLQSNKRVRKHMVNDFFGFQEELSAMWCSPSSN